MAWQIIRRATDTDHDRLQSRAEAFIARNGIAWKFSDHTLTPRALDDLLNDWAEDDDPSYAKHGRRLLKNWRRVVARALGDPCAEGIVWGYVGYHHG